MKTLNLKHAGISSLMVYAIGILAFVGSYFVPLMENPDLQANIVLMVAIAPAAFVGAHLYYRRGHTIHGGLVGATMFTGAIVLDALITVPVFIIPNGGTYRTFFGDPGFWLIGLEYIVVVVLYWQWWVIRNPVRQLI